METVAGIDFGTSNSAVSYKDSADVEIVRMEQGTGAIPTAMFFNGDSREVLFGSPAVDAFLKRNDGRFMRSIKSILGTNLMSGSTNINGISMDFQEIISRFISHLKQGLENDVGKPVNSVVIGRPVKFNETDAGLDRAAEDMLFSIAKSIGFKDVEFQFEPVAAAFSHERNIKGEQLAIVMDIGGGTSDFTVIRIGDALKNKTDRSDDILANSGVKVGGNTFDKYLSFNAFMPLLGKNSTLGSRHLSMPAHIYFELSDWSGINFMYNTKNERSAREIYYESNDKILTGRLVELVLERRGHELLRIVERAKIDMTYNDKITTTLSALSDAPMLDIMRSEFDEYSENIYDKIQKSLDECLAQSGVRREDIGLVILAGGSTGIIKIRDMSRANFPKAKLADGNKFLSVAEGLAHDAWRRFRH